MSGEGDGRRTEMLVLGGDSGEWQQLERALRSELSGQFGFRRAKALETGLESVGADPPDLVLMVGVFDGDASVESLQILEQYASKAPVLVVGDTVRPEHEGELLRHGASGVVDREVLSPEVVAGYVRNAVGSHNAPRRAERQLEQYKLIVENANDIFVLKDEEGRYQLVNQRAAEVLNAPRDEVIGATGTDFIDEKTAAQFR